MRIDLAQGGLTFPTRDQKMWKIGRVVGKKQFISFICYQSSLLNYFQKIGWWAFNGSCKQMNWGWGQITGSVLSKFWRRWRGALINKKVSFFSSTLNSIYTLCNTYRHWHSCSFIFHFFGLLGHGLCKR